jgi:hypothetical protein
MGAKKMSKRKDGIEKYCIICGKFIERYRRANGRLEDYGDYIRRKHFDRKCMGKSNLPRGSKPRINTKAGYVAVYSPDHPNKNRWGYVGESVLSARNGMRQII